MTSDDRFPCQRCAACCSMVGETTLGKSLALPDGSCKHLEKQTNLCSIYEHRPSFCRVDEYYEKNCASTMSRKAFHRQNLVCCEMLRDKQREKQKAAKT